MGLPLFYLALKRIPVSPWTSLHLLPVSHFFFSIPRESRFGYFRQIWLLAQTYREWSIWDALGLAVEVLSRCWDMLHSFGIRNFGNTTNASLNKKGKCCVARKFGSGWRSQNNAGRTMEMFYTELWFVKSEQNSVKSFPHSVNRVSLTKISVFMFVVQSRWHSWQCVCGTKKPRNCIQIQMMEFLLFWT